MARRKPSDEQVVEDYFINHSPEECSKLFATVSTIMRVRKLVAPQAPVRTRVKKDKAAGQQELIPAKEKLDGK